MLPLDRTRLAVSMLIYANQLTLDLAEYLLQKCESISLFVNCHLKQELSTVQSKL